MTNLSRENEERINHVLKHNHLIKKINALLEENGLHDFSVKTIELKANIEAQQILPNDCQEGYELQWICNAGATCEMRCVPVG